MERVDRYNWQDGAAALDRQGWTVLNGLLSSTECRNICSLYNDDSHFRGKIVMAQHGFGRGEYKYFAYPLLPLVAELRQALYERLAPVANHWNDMLRIERHFPPTHRAFLMRCAELGQTRPTPLLLLYEAGDYNCLHQDVYGELVFPVQVAILLSDPNSDFTGGEFVLTEQRPRMQSRATVVPLGCGDAIAFAVHHRPVEGVRGTFRVAMRHGVSALRSGRRFTLGIIFHDAN